MGFKNWPKIRESTQTKAVAVPSVQGFTKTGFFPRNQGCQIFLVTTYQNGKKYTK
jgi:hypothetical protein